MAFPVSPVNGQVAVVNNISYTYNSLKGRWVKNAGSIASNTLNTLTVTGSAYFNGSPN